MVIQELVSFLHHHINLRTAVNEKKRDCSCLVPTNYHKKYEDYEY